MPQVSHFLFKVIRISKYVLQSLRHAKNCRETGKKEEQITKAKMFLEL